MSRKRILFLAEGATMAHFVRPLALADSLDTSRYDVYFLCAVAILPLSERQAVGHRGASDYAG